MSLAPHLASLRSLRGVSASHIEAASRHFRPRILNNTEVLWEHRAPANSLAIVIDGQVQAATDLALLSKAGPGDILGEVTAFFPNKRRSARVMATDTSRLVELSRKGLQQLRADRNPVYERLLDEALRAMVKRLRRLDARIVAQVLGSRPTPSRGNVPTLVKMWRALVPGGPKTACPPLHVALRRRKDLADNAVALATALADHSQAKGVAEGEVIFLEGDPSDAVWVVAHGQLEVLRTQDAERSQLAGRLSPGAVFGMNGVLDGQPRSASVVASQPSWLYRIDQQAVRKPPRGVAVPFKEAQLITLAAQLRRATLAVDDAQLHQASGEVFATNLDEEMELLFEELSRGS